MKEKIQKSEAREVIHNGNILIADFMGGIEYILKNHWKGLERFETQLYYPDGMQFHNSWDWLMPVVERISQIRYDNQDDIWSYAFFRTKTYSYLPQEGKNIAVVRINRMGLHEADTMIEATWKAVVEFIECEKKHLWKKDCI